MAKIIADEAIVKYRCKHCGSEDVMGSLPAWFRLNAIGEHCYSVTQVDFKAGYDLGYCESCKKFGSFSDVIEQIDTGAASASAGGGR